MTGATFHGDKKICSAGEKKPRANTALSTVANLSLAWAVVDLAREISGGRKPLLMSTNTTHHIQSLPHSPLFVFETLETGSTFFFSGEGVVFRGYY